MEVNTVVEKFFHRSLGHFGYFLDPFKYESDSMMKLMNFTWFSQIKKKRFTEVIFRIIFSNRNMFQIRYFGGFILWSQKFSTIDILTQEQTKENGSKRWKTCQNFICGRKEGESLGLIGKIFSKSKKCDFVNLSCQKWSLKSHDMSEKFKFLWCWEINS